jgi:tetratricopeptide (TPR) repeat protein
MVAAGETALGIAQHAIGDQISARQHFERSLTKAQAAGAAQVSFFGYDHEIRAAVALARCEWLIGLPDQAARTARKVIDLATKRDQPVDLCNTLLFAATVFLWRGDLAEAEQLIGRLSAHAARHSFGPYITAGLALVGELTVARGDAAEGVALLWRALRMSQAQKYHTLTPAVHVALAEGLLMAGEVDEAASVVEAGLALIEEGRATLNEPELLRERGEIWLRMTPVDLEAAERSFTLALQKSRAQCAQSLELRSAMALASLWANQGKKAAAADLLGSVREQFTEGFETSDLRRADQLLAAIGKDRD